DARSRIAAAGRRVEHERRSHIPPAATTGESVMRKTKPAACKPSPNQKPAGFWQVIKSTFQGFMADHPFRLAAALAYYLVLALAPTVIVIIGAAGLVWGEKAVQGGLVEKIQTYLGREGAEV